MMLVRARIEDAPVLARLHVDSWRAAYRGLVPDWFLQRFTHERREQAFRQSLAAHAEETYLIQEDKEMVGLLTLGAARDPDLDARITGEIWGIYIAPDHWRQGIGRKVVVEAEIMLSSRGYSLAVVWVLEDNQPARAFYKALGYRADNTSKIINWAIPLQALRYRKDLWKHPSPLLAES